MSIKEKLQSDLLEAVRQRDELRRTALRFLKAGIVNEEKAKGRDLKDEEILEVLSREARRHKESIEAFHKGNRPDLVAKEEAEMAIISEYLPKQLSRDDIISMAKAIMQEVGAQGPGDKGRVMGKLMPQLRGKADGKMVNDLVTELLGASSH